MSKIKDKNKAVKKIIKEMVQYGMFEAIGDGISIHDTNYKILYQNKVLKNLIGEHIGEYCYNVYEKKKKRCNDCPLSEMFKDGKIHTRERGPVPTDKGTIYVENTASPILDKSGNIVAGIEVVRNITKRKQMEKLVLESERKLTIHAKELKESNIALKVLLKQRENDKSELEEKILSNIKHIIMPYIEKLKKNRSMSEELAYLNILESNLKEIVSPFSSKLSLKYLDFTPKEILVTNLIIDGKQDKDITELLNISIDTVKFHRKNIRKKLGIYGKRTNMRTQLLSTIK